MEAYLPYLLPAIAGVVSGGVLTSATGVARLGSMAQLVAGALGGLGGGVALAPLVLDLMGGPVAGGQGSLIGNLLGGVLGGGALTVLGGAMFGSVRR